MNFPIKFRGKGINGGTFHGDVIHWDVRVYIRDTVRLTVEQVKPESVAWFCAYDKNGKEIYSDDKIRVYDFNRYCLAGTGIEDAADFFKIADIGKTFDNVELFGESENNEKMPNDNGSAG